MFRGFIFALFFASFFVGVSAQGTVSLSADSVSLRVIETGEEFSSSVLGYRILIYSNSSQSARSEASFAAARAKALLPSISTVVEYDNPFFRTYAGSCLHRIEAVRLLGVLKRRFPNAVISTKQFRTSYFSSKDSEFTLELGSDEDEILIED